MESIQVFNNIFSKTSSADLLYVESGLTFMLFPNHPESQQHSWLYLIPSLEGFGYFYVFLF